MIRLLLRLYPRWWRHRYGREVVELLAASRRPWADAVDVARTALGIRLAWFLAPPTRPPAPTEVPMPRPLRIVATALAFAAVFCLGYAVNDLRHGIVDVPMHWWSTLPLVGLGVAGALWVLAGRVPVSRGSA